MKKNGPQSIQKKSSIRDSIAALKYIPRFFIEIHSSNPPSFWVNVISRLVSAIIPVALLYIGKLLIDAIVAEIGNDEANLGHIWKLVSIEMGLVVLSDLLTRLIQYTDGLLGDYYANDSSVKIIKKTKDVEISQLEDPVFYDKLERARTQTTNRVFLMSNVLSQAQAVITITSLIVALVAFAPVLILLVFISVIPSFINEMKFSSQSYSLARSWTQERRELDYLRYIGANDKTAKEMKLFGLSDFIANRYHRLSLEYLKVNRSLALRRTVWGFAFNLIGVVCYYGAYTYIIMKTVMQLISIGDLTFLSGSFNRLKGQLEGMFNRFTKISESALYLKDYFDFIDLKTDDANETSLLSLPEQIVEGFVFENVTFTYPGSDRPVLKGLNFRIKAGEKIAFVGENGAGKTTLIKLLLRFYEPSSGTIMLDGIDIKRFDKSAYQQVFGVIFQDFVRYEFNVRENIAVGNIASLEDEPKILAAAERSLANEVIEGLEEGLDQKLGKRFTKGKDLSGGQWQKVALARAYMKDASVLILDEPTSALDARAEYEAFLRFIDLTQGKIAVIISHRFSTVRMADQIMVLVDGQCSEYGSHDELMKSNLLYAELFQLQAQGYQ